MDSNNPILTTQEENLFSIEKHELLSAERAQELNEKYAPKALPLQREVTSPKHFPFDALGPMLAPIAKRIHEIVKAPDSICGQSVLAAAALVAQGYADVSIDGRSYPLSLFMLTVAESGDRKSAVDSIVLKPVRDYEKMLAKTHVEEKRLYKNKLDAWKRQREAILREGKPDLDMELNKAGKEPSRPLEPHLLLEEPSYEGLVKLLALGQPSIGLFSDEGGRMFGGYAMGKDNFLKTACGLSSLWDGKPITRIRGGDENLLLYGRRFSSHLMLQEVVLASVLKNEVLSGQGLIARYLVVAPSSNAGDRPYNPVDISQDPIIQQFYAHISSFLDQALPLANPDTPNELLPRLLLLSTRAKEKWTLFHDEIDKSLKLDGLYYLVRRTANKAAEQVLRIGGVLSVAENFETATISEDAIERAIELMRFYLDEALRIAEMNSSDPDLELAQSLLNWMKKKIADENNTKKIFTLQEIYQKAGPRGIRKKQIAKKIIEILEDHKVVTKVDCEDLAWSVC